MSSALPSITVVIRPTDGASSLATQSPGVMERRRDRESGRSRPAVPATQCPAVYAANQFQGMTEATMHLERCA